MIVTYLVAIAVELDQGHIWWAGEKSVVHWSVAVYRLAWHCCGCDSEIIDGANFIFIDGCLSITAIRRPSRSHQQSSEHKSWDHFHAISEHIHCLSLETNEFWINRVANPYRYTAEWTWNLNGDLRSWTTDSRTSNWLNWLKCSAISMQL